MPSHTSSGNMTAEYDTFEVPIERLVDAVELDPQVVGVEINPDDERPIGWRVEVAFRVDDEGVLTLDIYEPDGRTVRLLFARGWDFKR